MKKKLNYAPRVESLESRKLMAGDVAVALEGSFLRIEGDALSNQIAIVQNAAGDVIVSGQTGTRINGLPAVRFVRPQLESLSIEMADGNDTVSIQGVRTTNDFFADLGAGDDRLTSALANPVSIGANMFMQGGLGTDTVSLAGTAIAGDANIDGGLGVMNATLNGARVDGFMTMLGDDANDVITLNNSTAGLGVSIETKGGSDRVSITGLNAFGLHVNTDSNGAIGVDQVTMNRVTTREDIGVFTGAGNDIVRMTDVQSGKAITVSLDEGNDRLIATRVRGATDVVLEGGAGVDTLENFGIQGGIKREIKEFELLR